MSAPGSVPAVVDLPSIVDEKFLAKAVEILERLRSESELRGHPLLSSLLAITKGEAEDTLRTHTLAFHPAWPEHDDGVVALAQKFAWRAKASA